MLTSEELLQHYRRQRRWTRALVAAIPEEYFPWRPAPDAFGCGDLVRHLMQSEIFWNRLLCRAARGEPYDPFGLPGGPEERLEALRQPNLQSSRDEKYGASFAGCLERWAEIQKRTEHDLAALEDAWLGRLATHPLTGLEAAVWEMALVMLAHEGHHRGQLSAYLKMLGVPQPAAIWTG